MALRTLPQRVSKAAEGRGWGWDQSNSQKTSHVQPPTQEDSVFYFIAAASQWEGVSRKLLFCLIL